MKHVLCCMAFLASVNSATATSFGGLEHEVHFSENSGQIRSEEMRSLVDWKINSVEMGGIDYEVFLYKDEQLEIGSNLVEQRRDTIVSLMNTLGIQITKVVVIDQQSKRRESGLSRKKTNTATIIFQPPCTKTLDCGPKPISGSKPPELNKIEADHE
ncbi:hypothetical protein [Collimonas silvisoli]|uniref:hypothetical protein n=1 Tax=Collimonas silvisoli TaxID=2825884 RepID=UPI001B8C489D|nr:hypothetical protein [Collimonas silvisoli]